MVCSLCGGKHNLRTCPLPGAKLHRQFLAEKRRCRGHAKYPQQGRKPPRLGSLAWGKKLKKASANYSGRNKTKRDRELRTASRKKGYKMIETEEGQMEAWKELLTHGFAKKPVRCQQCGYSLGAPFVVKKKHVYQRCINEHCRRRQNVLTCAAWLNHLTRFSLTPMQLLQLLKSYTASHANEPPSAYVLARQIGSTYKPVRSILDACGGLSAAAAERSNKRLKLHGNLELDATSLRKIRIGPLTTKYQDLVREWQRRHPHRRNRYKHYFVSVCYFVCQHFDPISSFGHL